MMKLIQFHLPCLLMTLLLNVIIINSESPKPCVVTSERVLIDCQLVAPHHVNISCQSWNTAKIAVDADKYGKLPNRLKPLVIKCQRGLPFYLDSSKLNWTYPVYEITQGNQISVEEKTSGVYHRHGFAIKIAIKDLLKVGYLEKYKFYIHDDLVRRNFTDFTLYIEQSGDMLERQGKDMAPPPLNINSPNQDLIIDFLDAYTAMCNSTNENEIIDQFLSVNFTNPSDSQIYTECLRMYSVDNCTKRIACNGKDPIKNCNERVRICKTNSSQSECVLDDIQESGVLVCTTKLRSRNFVEFFTALDNFKYRIDSDIAIDKLVAVKLAKENVNKLFYPGQWVNISYKAINYRFPGELYWEYKLKDGHLASFVYGDDRENIGNTVRLKMQKGMRQLLYFIPWSPYPIGSAIDILVTDKSAPHSSKENASSTLEVLGTDGKQLDLVCEVWGNPAPQLKWLKANNEEIMDKPPHYEILKSSHHEKSVSILHFTSFTSGDMGDYICEASNTEGAKSIKWHVGVNSRIGYEAGVGIVLVLVAGILIGTICYQIWLPPKTDKM